MQRRRHRKHGKDELKKNKSRSRPFKAKSSASFSFKKRSYSYLFTLPSLPLWLTQFFYLFFVYQNTLRSSLWLNLFLLSFLRGQPSDLHTLLNLYPSVFFQRSSSLSSSSYSFLYFAYTYDSRRFFRSAIISFNDFDRRHLPRRSLWVVRKKPWRRYSTQMFEGYKRFDADSFFAKHLFLSFDYNYSVRFSISTLSLFSNVRVHKNRPKL
jgi:hypothetical protein